MKYGRLSCHDFCKSSAVCLFVHRRVLITMKFALKNPTAGLRRGIITGINRIPDFQMETPNILLYTQGGTVPHLTPDVLHLLSPSPQAVLLPVPNIATIQERMKETSMNIGQFIGLANLMSVVTLIDPGCSRLEGFHKKDKVAVQTRFGKKEYSAEDYMDFIGSLKPDVFVALNDGDTKKDSSNKRVEKSMSRSSTMLKLCSELANKHKTLKSSAMLVPLEGGHNDKLRESYGKEVSEYADQASGLVIDGLGQFGEEVATRDALEYEELILASLKSCTVEGVRVLPGAWHPRTIFHLIELGIDLFDTTYPQMLTEKGRALLLPISPEASPPAKKGKPSVFEISLKEESNAEAFEPICSTCECHCCKNHTRAYIHHLLNVNEMTASVLLNIHNLQQYLEFFAAIRRSIDSETFQQLKNNFL